MLSSFASLRLVSLLSLPLSLSPSVPSPECAHKRVIALTSYFLNSASAAALTRARASATKSCSCSSPPSPPTFGIRAVAVTAVDEPELLAGEVGRDGEGRGARARAPRRPVQEGERLAVLPEQGELARHVDLDPACK